LQALTPRLLALRERTDDLRRFYRLPEEDAAKAEVRAVASKATRLVCSAAAPLRTPQEAAEEEEEEGDDDASGSDLSEEQGAAPAREGARRGIRGSVSVSSSSSDEGAA
jgi:hypothetical protein